MTPTRRRRFAAGASIDGALRISALLGVATLAVTLMAAPADAHGSAGQAPVNTQTRVIDIVPDHPGVQARITDLGEHVVLTTDGAEVIVFGYDGEEYLRIDDDGVWRNERSPATFLNRRLDTVAEIPDSYDASAAPQWQRMGDGRTARWHDHRLHPGAGASTEWQVTIAVDGVTTIVRGETTRESPPPVWSAIALVVGIAILSALVLRERRAVGFVIIGAVLAVGCVALSIARWRASTEPTGTRLVVFAPTLLGVVLTLGALRLRRGLGSAAPWLVFGFGGLALAFGVALIPWLTHAVLPALGPAPLWRVVVASALGSGSVAVALAAGALRVRPSPPGGDLVQ